HTSVELELMVLMVLMVLTQSEPSEPSVFDPGDDVILPCQADGSSIRAVEWTRPDLEPEYVLLYRDGHLDPTNQHPSFKDRVELVDRDLKDGDVSLTLKNVSRHDAGTYECRVASAGSKQDEDCSTITHLLTHMLLFFRPSSPGGREDLLAAAVLVVVMSFLIYRRHKKKRSGQPADDDDDEAFFHHES
uniref:Ig-like domain-containing protein n=1 Tax=Sander lucioperca TaxID=283035 RepID=A0A8C9XV08_SANLU